MAVEGSYRENGGKNIYGFTTNNPVSYIDYLGNATTADGSAHHANYNFEVILEKNEWSYYLVGQGQEKMISVYVGVYANCDDSGELSGDWDVSSVWINNEVNNTNFDKLKGKNGILDDTNNTIGFQGFAEHDDSIFMIGNSAFMGAVGGIASGTPQGVAAGAGIGLATGIWNVAVTGGAESASMDLTLGIHCECIDGVDGPYYSPRAEGTANVSASGRLVWNFGEGYGMFW